MGIRTYKSNESVDIIGRRGRLGSDNKNTDRIKIKIKKIHTHLYNNLHKGET